MRAGGGKQKGSAFERDICKALSLWITDGKKTDVFWRSAMSGGRATVQHRRGVSIRQSGDITTVAPEGHILTDSWYIECKHVKKLDLESFLLKDKGTLAGFWRTAIREAKKHHKYPMIIARQNGWPTLVITRRGMASRWTWSVVNRVTYGATSPAADITLFDKMVEENFYKEG